jgi:PhnB protein
MTSTTESVRTGIKAATPYLAIRDAAAAIEFYKAAFAATQTGDFYQEESGRIGHAELLFGDALIMLSDEHPEIDVLGPQSRGGSTAAIVLQVEDADAVFNRAIAAGATATKPLRDEPYGRTGEVKDPYGHRWFICRY